MRSKQWATSAAVLLASLAGVAGGVFLAAVTTPTPAFAGAFMFDRASIISWRNGDSLPPEAQSAGWSGPMFYTFAADGAKPDGPAGQIPTGVWAPGDEWQRSLTVKNVDPDYMMRLERLEIRLSGSTGLAPHFKVAVTASDGGLLFNGKLSDFAGSDLPLAARPLLKLGSHTELVFRVTLDRDTDQRYQGQTVSADVVVHARAFAVPTTIDIHPASWPNPINPGATGSIPVAVNGSAVFDVKTLDWASARFGPNRAPPLKQGRYEDWNGDRYPDLILHFDNPRTGITCGMTTATLTIASLDGTVYEGSDAIKTPSCA